MHQAGVLRRVGQLAQVHGLQISSVISQARFTRTRARPRWQVGTPSRKNGSERRQRSPLKRKLPNPLTLVSIIFPGFGQIRLEPGQSLMCLGGVFGQSFHLPFHGFPAARRSGGRCTPRASRPSMTCGIGLGDRRRGLSGCTGHATSKGKFRGPDRARGVNFEAPKTSKPRPAFPAENSASPWSCY